MIKNFLVYHFVLLLLLWMWYSYHQLSDQFTDGITSVKDQKKNSVDIQRQTTVPTSSRPSSPSKPVTSLPIRREGVIFFTDAATGPVRDAALALTSQGFHVLVGASSKAEQRSFAYLARKGLEIIPFNLYDPSTYPDVIYRLRHIRRDLDRPLVSFVINVADYVEKEAFPVIPAKKKSVESTPLLLDVDYASTQYRNIIKSPMRFTQALLELVRLQTIEGDYNPVLERKLQIANGVSGNEKNSSSSSSSTKGTSDDKAWDLGAVRITLLVASPPTATTPSGSDNQPIISEEEEEQTIMRCGIVCLYQQTTIDYFHQLSRADVLKNLSVSIIPTKTLSLSIKPSSEDTNLDTIFAKDMDWAIGGADGEINVVGTSTMSDSSMGTTSGDDKKITTAGKAIIHALLSKTPHLFYDLEDKSLNLNFKSKKLLRKLSHRS